MKVRHLCAILGVAIAVGTIVFMRSLVETNDAQSQAVADRLLKEVPIADGAKVSHLTLDYRPGGHVLQGPPMRVVAAEMPGAKGCVVTRAMFAQRMLSVPEIGTELTLVGRDGAYKVRITGIIDWDRPVRGYPNMILGDDVAGTITERWDVWKPISAVDLASAFESEDGRNMSRARPLLLWAAALTALCLLLNSLFLSIESRRKEIAILRMFGMTRSGVVKSVLKESIRLTAIGFVLGIVMSSVVLWLYVRFDVVSYPMGMALSYRSIAGCAIVAPVISFLAACLALKPALSVRPLEAASNRTPRKRHVGMLVSFAFGFGAFVAVEVWGSSLMSAFIPSAEFPDAIVSILPAGVSAFDITKVQGKLKGVRRIHELQPLQVNFDPLEEMTGFKSQRPGGGKSYRNALLLASDYLPPFRFVEGDRDSAWKAIMEGDACLITEMMARARNLKLGDDLRLDCGRGFKMSLKIVGLLDLNWHMVTSRALVRGLNRMPMNTDGPVFVSFDTLSACDARPQEYVKMTHLWLDYEDDFVDEHGILKASQIVEKEIEQVFHADGNTVRTHARDEISDGTLSHGNDIIGAMARVPFIFIAVISLGFVAMLVASADNRKREFVVLRTVGATRLQLAMVLAGEAMRIAVVGIAIGLVGGAIVGWLFTHGTRAAMANWGIPPNFAVPWFVLLQGAIGSIVFSLLVAVPTSLILIHRRK